MISKQFNKFSPIARYVIYILIAINLLAFIIGAGILLLSEHPLSFPLLLVILFPLCISLLGFIILSYFYGQQQEVKEKRHLLRLQKRLKIEINNISIDIDHHEKRRGTIIQNNNASLAKRRNEFSQKIQHLSNRHSQVSLSESNEISSSLAHLQNQHISQGLQLASIVDANIPGVGPKLKERLTQNGITCAAHVSLERITGIQGFGESKVKSVIQWRKILEAGLLASKPTRLPPDVEGKIRLKHSQQHSQIQEEEAKAKTDLELDLTSIQQRSDHLAADNDLTESLAKEKLSSHKEKAVGLNNQLQLYSGISPFSYLQHCLVRGSSTRTKFIVGASAGVIALFPLFFLVLGAGTTVSMIGASIPTHTSTPTVTPTYTSTNTQTPTFTFTPSKTPTITRTPTPTNTSTITLTPTITPTPTITLTPTITPLSSPTLPYNIASCIPRGTLRQVGYVVGVTDGDTINVRLDDGNVYPLRYIGMDTPEQGDIGYGPSATRNTDLVYGKSVTLVRDVSETDQYDRLLRYVIVGNIFVNNELVRSGLATAYRYPPDTACSNTFSDAEDYARANQLGLWAPIPTQRPTTPGDGGAVCGCSGNLYNCSDFSSHAKAQSCYNYCMSLGVGDIHRLDGDNDGLACESLP